jgi:hypothetical protein
MYICWCNHSRIKKQIYIYINNSRWTYFNELFLTEDRKIRIPYDQPIFFLIISSRRKKKAFFLSSNIVYNIWVTCWVALKNFSSSSFFAALKIVQWFFFFFSSSLSFIFHLYVSNIFSSFYYEVASIWCGSKK